MAGFRKAKAEQAAIKAGFYGLAGSGKTFTALLCAEGLARHCKKRVAYVDTERGTDFYCRAVAERNVHPEAFDFDAIYTKSLTEVIAEVKKINPDEHGVLVLDSITHLWDAAMLAYSGKKTSVGTIPMQAWSSIKKPYKELMTLILSSPLHVIICGRQGNEWAEDEKSGELKRIGTKMKAEGETPHEPHILIHFEAIPDRNGARVPTAITEKDRTGILSGKVIPLPNFDKLFRPIMPLLGGSQAKVATEDEVANQDAETIAADDAKRSAESATLLRKFGARFEGADTDEECEAIGKEITPAIKKAMLPADVTRLRQAWTDARARCKGDAPPVEREGDYADEPQFGRV